MRRIVSGGGAALLLLGLLVGVPALLLTIGSIPQFSLSSLLRPDDGTLLLGMLTIIGWLAWAVLAVTTGLETVNLIAGWQLRLPGLALPQRWMAGLLLSIAALAVASPTAGATTADGSQAPVQQISTQPSPAAETDAEHSKPPGGDAEGRPGPTELRTSAADDIERPHRDQRSMGSPDQSTHVIARGDNLWDLAEHYYGDGRQWRKIADANRQRIDDPDQLEIGWRLRLPDLPSLEAQQESDHQKASPPSRQNTDRTGMAEREGRSAESGSPADRARVSQSDSADESGAAGPATIEAAVAPGVAMAPGQLTSVAMLAGTAAAAIASTVTIRRQRMLQARPIGRRLASPDVPAIRIESELRTHAALELSDVVQAALAEATQHLRGRDADRPPLQRVVAGPDAVRLVFDDLPSTPPPQWSAVGSAWVRSTSIPIGEPLEEPVLWPALVCVGWQLDGQLIMIDLERFGVLNVGSARRDATGGNRAEAFRAALLLELTAGPSAVDVDVIMVGGDHDFATVLAEPQVSMVDRIGDVLPSLQRRAFERRNARPRSCAADVAEAWRPVIILCVEPVGDQLSQLTAVCDGETGIVAVLAGEPGLPVLDIDSDPSSIFGVDFHPQLAGRQLRDGVTSLLRASNTPPSDPAWWWDHELDEPGPILVAVPPRRAAEADPSEVADHDHHRAGQRVAPNELDESSSVPDPIPIDAAHGDRSRHGDGQANALAVATRIDVTGAPTLGLLGPLQLVGPAGTEPQRAKRQCIEYAAWLLENPVTTGHLMAQGLLVADGTRRSNLSRLRIWLGSDPDGEPYLPEAYSGRIELHPDVSSDWLRFQALILGGVNRASNTALAAALELVRGAPLADAAPGQWAWAEELRLDICSVIRDVALVLAERALAEREHELCGWALDKGTLAAEDDEQLLCLRLQLDHAQGNLLDAERLALRMTRHARALGVDLADETVVTIQRVLEGRPRRRA